MLGTRDQPHALCLTRDGYVSGGTTCKFTYVQMNWFSRAECDGGTAADELYPLSLIHI